MTLTADMMFVCGFSFLVTYSRNIKLTTTEFIPTCTAEQLAKSLMQVVYGYARGGFLVNLALIDIEFEKIKEELLPVEVNTTAAREHVPKIEGKIRTMKERVRSATSDSPFDPIPRMILIQTVYTIIMWLNAVWPLSGVTRGLSPCELVTGREVDCNKDCRSNFGAYVQATTERKL